MNSAAAAHLGEESYLRAVGREEIVVGWQLSRLPGVMVWSYYSGGVLAALECVRREGRIEARGRIAAPRSGRRPIRTLREKGDDGPGSPRALHRCPGASSVSPVQAGSLVTNRQEDLPGRAGQDCHAAFQVVEQVPDIFVGSHRAGTAVPPSPLGQIGVSHRGRSRQSTGESPRRATSKNRNGIKNARRRPADLLAPTAPSTTSFPESAARTNHRRPSSDKAGHARCSTPRLSFVPRGVPGFQARREADCGCRRICSSTGGIRRRQSTTIELTDAGTYDLYSI